jgi:hypothetical protein
MAFLEWFKNNEMPDETKWLVVGDFNLIRTPQNRNKPRGSISKMFAFNEAISSLSLVEIPLKGCKYTWTNKQQDPLLERLDWFFLLTLGSHLSLTHVPRSSQGIPQIIPLVLSLQLPKSQSQIFSYLKITGLNITSLLTQCCMVGACPLDTLISPRISVPSSRTLEEFSKHGKITYPP